MTTPPRLYPAAKQLDDQVPQEPLPSSLTEAHSLTVAVDVHIIDHVLHLWQLVQECRRPLAELPANETMQTANTAALSSFAAHLMASLCTTTAPPCHDPKRRGLSCTAKDDDIRWRC